MKLMGLLVTLIIIVVIVFIQVKAFNSSYSSTASGHTDIKKAEQAVTDFKTQDQNFQKGY